MENTLPTISEQLKLFFQSPIFMACFCSWFGAQFIKTAINLCYGRVKSFKQLIELMLVKTGGMTSSHSTSCLVGIGNESIQKRVSKVMKNRTRSEHVASQDSISATSESTCCIKRDSSNDSHFAIQI